jgi:hypothetical protein
MDEWIKQKEKKEKKRLKELKELYNEHKQKVGGACYKETKQRIYKFSYENQ